MFLKLGIVGRALGLQGSFYVSGRDEPIPDTVISVKIGRTLQTAREGQIISRGWQQGRPNIKCSLAGDRTASELLTGMTIWVDESQIKLDNSKEFLLKDLQGRTVIDSDGIVLGTVDNVIKMPASINIIVLKPDESADVDIPMISDYVDMNFDRGGSELKLMVPGDTFDEIWNARVKK
jgi:ribosomal 30S subunit maturation factor RimM